MKHIFRQTTIIAFVAGVVFFASSFLSSNSAVTPAQAESTMVGVVTTKDGQPIPGVLVYGSLSKSCCPFKREQTKTDSNGEFHLNNPGEVVHFSKEPFEPRALVVTPEMPSVRVVLETSAVRMVVPSCSKPKSHHRRIGGKFGLQFEVDTHYVKILGGKPDVDYVRYLIRPKTGTGYLELWFGPYALSPEPEDELFVQSVSFQQRNIVDVSGGYMGVDSSGRLKSGEAWRRAFIISEGARYRTDPENATLFDMVMDSACYIPYPKN